MRVSWKRRRAAVLIALAAMICWWFYGSKYGLEVTNYVISTPKLTEPVRIVQLTDLHNSQFGEDNGRLVNLVKKQRPDIIVLTGDMLNGDEPKTGIATRLIEQLVKIAPVYSSYGNHERANERVYGSDTTALYEQAGAHVLERGYADVAVNGQMIRLGGVLGYCLSEKYLRTGEARLYEVEYLKQFQDTDLFTILLCHFPLCWIKDDNLEEWDIDCIFAGHVHGGQIRLPIIGGAYAPDQGLFPGRMCGLYDSQDRKRVMVLSRGLGSRGSVPRINNVPEIVVVDILPQMK